jgi:hypothetical protein
MTGAFQAFAVRGTAGPVVTLQAGVDFAGYFWTTTSRTAGKVKALRRDPIASVLTHTHDSWVLRAGRAVILDPIHPSEAMRELPALAMAGPALALIAARYPEQLLGYVADGMATPQSWRPYNRVLIAVRHDDQIKWTDDGLITEQTARFTSDQDSGRTPRPVRAVDSRCWLGLDSDDGPLVLPGEWRSARSTVRVPAGVLAALRPRLPGPACITIDESRSRRPSDKTGIIARGQASDCTIRMGTASIVVEVDSVTTWNGFRSTVAAA